MWGQVFTHVITALLLFQIIMAALLAIKQSFSAILVAPTVASHAALTAPYNSLLPDANAVGTMHSMHHQRCIRHLSGGHVKSGIECTWQGRTD